MSQVVLSDGQWTMFRYLLPFPNFERVYQGVPGNTPIAFPGTLDLFAEKKVVGYDPNLLGAITVPLGSRVTIWIPQTLSQADPAGSDFPPVVDALYQYQILWRNRTTRDFRVGQAAGIGTAQQSYSNFHLPTSGLGQTQNVLGSAADQRIFLPGGLRTVGFEQAEPVGTVPSVLHLRGEYLQPIGDPVWVPPLTPGGAPALWQQGTYRNSASPNGGGPSYFTFTTDAEGDEMSILASKIDPSTTWDFTATAPGDGAFSNTYGTNNGQNLPSQYGILVTTGMS